MNACTCRTIVLAAGPEDRDGWTQQGVDWNKNRSGAKSGHFGQLLEPQKVSEDRTKELANIEKLNVAEITLQEARAQGSEIVHVGWLDDAARGTPQDPDASGAEWVRHRSAHTTVKMWCRRHYQPKRPRSF